MACRNFESVQSYLAVTGSQTKLCKTLKTDGLPPFQSFQSCLPAGGGKRLKSCGGGKLYHRFRSFQSCTPAMGSFRKSENFERSVDFNRFQSVQS